MRAVLVMCLAVFLCAAEFRPPAGERHASRRPGIESILPGGRTINPLGAQYIAGAGPFGLALSPDGRFAVTANSGPNRYSLTVLDLSGYHPRTNLLMAPGTREKDSDDDAWESVSIGLTFFDKDSVFSADGNSGKVRLLSLPSGRREETLQLDQGSWRDSYSGDIAFDRERSLLYVADQANFRVAIFNVKNRKLMNSVRVGRLPFRLILSPDATRLYVTNVGMFHYSVIPGADAKQPRQTGLPFPAFGFPSHEAEHGARRQTAAGTVDVPGLGDPNVVESNSLAIVDTADPGGARVAAFVRTGQPVGPASLGGSSPSGVLATAGAVYISNANQDSITVVDPASMKVRSEIPLRMQGLEELRGILPLGMAFDSATGWLLVAEAGINAIGIVDTRTDKLIGHIPSGWFPTAVAIGGGSVYVSNAKGHGTGPNATKSAPLERSQQAELRNGSLSVFSLPDAASLPKLTAQVASQNGLTSTQPAADPLPSDLKYVVIVLKENRAFDEIFGDIDSAANGPVNGARELARLGSRGWVTWGRGDLLIRLGKNFHNITPNHHEMARRWAFSDNFYSEAEVGIDGHHWIVGSYPNGWTESSLRSAYGGQKTFRLNPGAPGRLIFAEGNSSVHPEEQLQAGALWHHLERHGIPFRNFGEGFELAGVDESEGLDPTGARFLTNMPMPEPLYRNTSRTYPNVNVNIPDQLRANHFIEEIDRLYTNPGNDLPRLLFIHLPNDRMAKPRPEDGYPFQASFVADNDYALGRIIEYLSHTPWWKQMAIFVTEDGAQGGVDHVDSHRTVLLVASPYAKRNYVSHVNSSFPGLLKTVFRILGLPPLNLFDATAADLGDCFWDRPDFEPYTVRPSESEIFVPEKARESLESRPPARTNDSQAPHGKS
jgi:DNA-binding beta-propeller fold protein YncE